ncbi:phylloplanin-like isoform X1 [Vigna unguiculata]|uniref:phylloplanin-like isoform X1 n=1 Tax=Vigna unguiculata TaxID=3917 RepID=UPI0010162711|nr:phylloplanin-like isoform X1 [Vigna unguiculata]
MSFKHPMMFLLIAAMAIPQTKAKLGFLSALLGSVSNIQGTVFCSSKDNVAVKAPSNPVFPKTTQYFSDAEVQLVCGEKEFSSARTNDDGKFSIMMDPLLLDVSSLLNGCNLVVPTPLSNCNTNLPSSGTLISTLNFAGINRLATPIIANIIPSGFHYVPST